MEKFPKRKNVRLAQLNYRGHHCYFVTFCSLDRHTVFLSREICESLLELLRTESRRLGFRTHAYCLMPDHLHFLSEGTQPSSDLLALVKCLKIKSSRWYARMCGRALWQKGFYEHILRSDDPIEAVAWYIWMNPVRKGLVGTPGEFQYSGSFAGMNMPAEWNKPAWCPPWKARSV